ncbi:MAG: HEAT repeat domain-containing protein [Candidatus Entotheonellia bacterium]
MPVWCRTHDQTWVCLSGAIDRPDSGKAWNDHAHRHRPQNCQKTNNITTHDTFDYAACRIPPLSLNWLLAFLLVMSCFSLLGKAAEPIPEPKPWQIKGALAALADANLEVRARALKKLRELQSLGSIPTDQIPKLVSLVQHPQSEVRAAAAEALGSMRETAEAYAPTLAGLLTDPDQGVRAAAAEALRAMGETAKEYAPQLKALLQDSKEEWEVRVAVAKALVAMGEFVDLVQHPQSEVRAAAAEAVEVMGETAKAYAPRLAILLQDPNEDVRAAAAKMLGAMGKIAQQQAPKLAGLLRDPSRDVQVAAARALGAMGETAKEQAPELANLLGNPNRYVRLVAAQALVAMGEGAKKQALETIRDLLQDPDANVRSTTARALEVIGKAAQEQAPTLATLLSDADESVRVAAADALRAIGEAAQEHTPKLGDLLQDSKTSMNLRVAAMRALGAMGQAAEEQVPKIVAQLQDPDSFVRLTAVRTLGVMGEVAQEQASKIADLLEARRAYVRVAAAQALETMGEAAKEWAPTLAARLQDPDHDVRAAAAQALGTMGKAAKEWAPQLAELLSHWQENVRRAAVRALGAMGEAAKEQAPKLVKRLQDPHRYIRFDAAEALGTMGEAARHQIPEIVGLLKDPDKYVHHAAAQALRNIGPLDVNSLLHILNPVYDDVSRLADIRFLVHFLGSGEQEAEILMQWLGWPDQTPETLTHDDGVNTLQVFEAALGPSIALPKLRADLEARMAQVVPKVTWQSEDRHLLQRLARHLQSVKSTRVAQIQNVISALEGRRRVVISGGVWLMHALFWLLLIVAYPRSSQIQAIFFWNPWMRRIVGLGYVGFALTWVPYLRQKLFAPFRASLLSDAALESFDPHAYFAESDVTIKPSGGSHPIREAIPEIRGQIVLEGESGLGKTMFLRDLVCHSRRIVVYLPAEKCAQGPIEAIQAKLHGPARDPNFLRNLIYSGAIDICIDGLNEVTADTRAKVTQFVESYFKGNIIMATQPLEWRAPSTAKTHILQPLGRDQIERFLLTRTQVLPEYATVTGQDYAQACRSYLAEALDERQPEETLATARRILSNPMDLIVVAQMLAGRQKPDLFHLQEQQYTVMATDYKRVHLNQEFPLRAFSERIYQMRLEDKTAFPAEEFLKELQCMERHKMVLIRQALDSQGNPTKEWRFRHDKIMEFFMVQTFLGADNDRPQKHLGDPRFRGVYFLLAMILPPEAAEALRELLIQYAADTKDRTVSDEFIQILRSRKAASKESYVAPDEAGHASKDGV